MFTICCIYPSVYPSICPSVHLSIHPSVHPSIDLSIRSYVRLSICPSVRLFICPSVHLPIDLSIPLFSPSPSARLSLHPSIHKFYCSSVDVSVGPCICRSSRQSLCGFIDRSICRSVRIGPSNGLPVRLSVSLVAKGSTVELTDCQSIRRSMRRSIGWLVRRSMHAVAPIGRSFCRPNRSVDINNDIVFYCWPFSSALRWVHPVI